MDRLAILRNCVKLLCYYHLWPVHQDYPYPYFPGPESPIKYNLFEFGRLHILLIPAMGVALSLKIWQKNSLLNLIKIVLETC